MKTIKTTVMLLVLAAMCACGQTNKNNQAEEIDATEVTVENTDPAAPIEVTLDENSSAVVTGSMTGLKDMKTYVVEVPAGKKLSIKLTPAEEIANLRIHQIISPSDEADGPFGQDATTDVTEAGKWSIVIGESLMVGEDYIGDYTLSIAVL